MAPDRGFADQVLLTEVAVLNTRHPSPARAQYAVCNLPVVIAALVFVSEGVSACLAVRHLELARAGRVTVEVLRERESVGTGFRAPRMGQAFAAHSFPKARRYWSFIESR